MKLGIISDVHGNAASLERALDGLALPRFRLSDEPPEHTPWSLNG